MDREKFSDFVKTFIKKHSPHLTNQLTSIDITTDLIDEGLVDSFLFIELCFAIEEETGFAIDISELEDDDFSIVKLFSKLKKEK